MSPPSARSRARAGGRYRFSRTFRAGARDRHARRRPQAFRLHVEGFFREELRRALKVQIAQLRPGEIRLRIVPFEERRSRRFPQRADSQNGAGLRSGCCRHESSSSTTLPARPAASFQRSSALRRETLHQASGARIAPAARSALARRRHRGESGLAPRGVPTDHVARHVGLSQRDEVNASTRRSVGAYHRSRVDGESRPNS